MQTPDISITSLILCLLLLLIPFIIDWKLKTRKIKGILIAVFRMIIQLGLMGIFLKYLFQYDNFFLNTFWFFVMIITATFSVIKQNGLRHDKFIFPVFASLFIATFFIILYFNYFIVKIEYLFSARFFVVVSGMLLGNAMKANIIALNNFYKGIKRNNNRFLNNLASGATLVEALLPYIREAMNASLQPMIASMAIMGVVFIPGMMTGQILGGVSPVLAIKYQIVIVVSIFVAMVIGVTLSLFLTIKTCFDSYGMLKTGIFKSDSK